MPDPCLPHSRIARATEALQTFRPAASSSFRHCQLDVGREMKLLTELNFLRGKELARPMSNQSLLPFPPQQRTRGAVPTRDLLASCLAWPATPTQPTLPHHPTALSAASPSLFVGCGHGGLCSGTPQASQQPCPGGPATRRAPSLLPPSAPTQLGHPHIASFCPNVL